MKTPKEITKSDLEWINKQILEQFRLSSNYLNGKEKNAWESEYEKGEYCIGINSVVKETERLIGLYETSLMQQMILKGEVEKLRNKLNEINKISDNLNNHPDFQKIYDLSKI
jgi:hypothetical protein